MTVDLALWHSFAEITWAVRGYDLVIGGLIIFLFGLWVGLSRKGE